MVYFNFRNINNIESTLFNYLKLLLLTQVVLGHITALSMPTISELPKDTIFDYIVILLKASVSFGRESAYLFIFLSGFFTAKIFLNENKTFAMLTVILNRFKRLYPILIIALILTFLLDYMGIYIFDFHNYEVNGLHYIVKDHFSMYLFFTNFLSLEPTFSLTFGSNGPLWTLGYLVQFFILSSILKKISEVTSINFLLISLIFFILFWNFFTLQFIALFVVWLLGMYLRYQKIKFLPINVYIILLVIVLLFFFSKLSPRTITMMITPLTGFFILQFVKGISISKIYNKYHPINISDISYVLYVIHMPLLFFIYGVMENILNKKFMIDYYIIYIFLSFISSVYFSIKIQNILEKR